jgi:ribosomal protein L37AE/L43A
MTLESSGERLNLEEIEDFHKSLQACPECKSKEGFWLIAKRDATFFQCKHCAVILEACKIFPTQKEPKDFKLVIKLRR